ncbi:MAG: diacylglycerol kinase family lipid kinase [Chloroflexi bacterium]|nr:diacylglycerol kinase family lipid kinase [Chloroflexota bacterium]
MKVKVILNPYANRWRAGERLPEVEAALTAVGITPDIAQTSGPGEGIALAAAAVSQGYDAVVAAGGEGTLNEVVNGLAQAAGDKLTIPFGALPLGSANDFCTAVGIPLDLTEAAQLIANGRTRQIDCGKINERYFINTCAVAMEPMVTLEHIKIQRIKGEMRYVAAMLQALRKLRAWQMQVTWDGGGYDGPLYLLSICNGPRSGGFYMAPDAQVDDGLLDYVMAPEVSKLTVVNILLKLMRRSHIGHKDVVYGRSSRILIKSQPGTPAHADGEIISESLTSIECVVLPGKVTLLA